MPRGYTEWPHAACLEHRVVWRDRDAGDALHDERSGSFSLVFTHVRLTEQKLSAQVSEDEFQQRNVQTSCCASTLARSHRYDYAAVYLTQSPVAKSTH
jgi:hypothetical protein